MESHKDVYSSLLANKQQDQPLTYVILVFTPEISQRGCQWGWCEDQVGGGTRCPMSELPPPLVTA